VGYPGPQPAGHAADDALAVTSRIALLVNGYIDRVTSMAEQMLGLALRGTSDHSTTASSNKLGAQLTGTRARRGQLATRACR